MNYNKAIYIAGRLSKNEDHSVSDAVQYLYNVSKMMETAQTVKEAGYSVLVPALDLLMGMKFGYKTYDDYFNNNLVWVAKADAVYLVPTWETSPGTRREMQYAIDNGVPVFDRLDEMYEYFNGVHGGNIVKVIDKDGKSFVIKYREEHPERYAKELQEFNKTKVTYAKSN
jgi:nucleoside 2-deoxyribosyltransferase